MNNRSSPVIQSIKFMFGFYFFFIFLPIIQDLYYENVDLKYKKQISRVSVKLNEQPPQTKSK